MFNNPGDQLTTKMNPIEAAATKNICVGVTANSNCVQFDLAKLSVIKTLLAVTLPLTNAFLKLPDKPSDTPTSFGCPLVAVTGPSNKMVYVVSPLLWIDTKFAGGLLKDALVTSYHTSLER